MLNKFKYFFNTYEAVSPPKINNNIIINLEEDTSLLNLLNFDYPYKLSIPIVLPQIHFKKTSVLKSLQDNLIGNLNIENIENVTLIRKDPFLFNQDIKSPVIQVSNSKVSTNLDSLLKIDIEDLLRQEGITSINGKSIKFGNKNLRSPNAPYGAKNSNHKRRDPYTGYAMARDISIVGGTTKDYEDFRSKLLSNKRVVLWFDAKGWGILNEITPAILSKTRGTGPHFHFGPDKSALRTWKAWISNPNLPITLAV